MNTRLKMKIAIASTLTLLILGLGISRFWLAGKRGDSRRNAPAVELSGAGFSQPMPRTVSTDPVINTLMARFNLDAKAAAYVSGVHTQVISQSATSAHLVLTFSDGLTADETITLQPNQQYTPTAEEIAKAAQSGNQVYNVKFSATPDGDKLRLDLQYFVPYEALPPDLRQAIQTQTADWFQLVPSAKAQSGIGAGIGVGFGIAKQSVGALMGIWSAMGKSGQHQQWMSQLDALENCVQNPTNPLTKTAYSNNPAYQQNTLANIHNARSSVQQVTAARFLAQVNSVAAGLVAGPLAIVLGGLTALNDMTLKDVGNQEVLDAGKNVTDCSPQSTPPQAAGGDGTILYRMHRNGYLSYDSEDHFVQGSFNISAQPSAGVTLKGTGGFQGTVVSKKFGTNVTCKGASGISGTGGSGQLVVGSNALTGVCEGTEGGRAIHRDTYMVLTDNNFQCHFDNVDLVNGGKYSVQADGEESAWATCELELKPQQH